MDVTAGVTVAVAVAVGVSASAAAAPGAPAELGLAAPPLLGARRARPVRLRVGPSRRIFGFRSSGLFLVLARGPWPLLLLFQELRILDSPPSPRSWFISRMRALTLPISLFGFVLSPASAASSWHALSFARKVARYRLISSALSIPAGPAPAELGAGAWRAPWRYAAAVGHAVRIPFDVAIPEAANL